MRPEVTYIQQSATHSVSHLYEHIIGNKINAMLMSQAFLPLLDYRLDAITYDGMIVLTIEATDAVMLARLASLLVDTNITQDAVVGAVKQISCEVERLPRFEAAALLREVRQLHRIPWVRRQDYDRSTAITDRARTLNSQTLAFSRKSPRSFQQFSIVYRISDCPYVLKPLAVYLLQALALAQINLMTKNLPFCYDIGDEWAEYQDLVGYAHKLRFLKADAPPLLEFRNIEAAHREHILAADFTAKLIDYLSRHAADIIPYFGTKDMYAAAYQVVGNLGWKEIIKAENVSFLLDLLTVEVG
jgi:hypothetical protein